MIREHDSGDLVALPSSSDNTRRTEHACAMLAELARVAGAVRPPLSAQAVYIGMRTLPPLIAQHTGSREFRTALAELLPPPWHATRSDIEAGARWLAHHRITPVAGDHA